jgi:hypothetical protein
MPAMGGNMVQHCPIGGAAVDPLYPDAGKPVGFIHGASSPVIALIATTVAWFNSVSAREWGLDGAMSGAQQARCSSVAADMDRSTSAWVSCVGCLSLDMAISDGMRIAALAQHSNIKRANGQITSVPLSY